MQELRIASVSPGVAVLITPLLSTVGEPGKNPFTTPIRWGGVFVKTKSGWRISVDIHHASRVGAREGH